MENTAVPQTHTLKSAKRLELEKLVKVDIQKAKDSQNYGLKLMVEVFSSAYISAFGAKHGARLSEHIAASCTIAEVLERSYLLGQQAANACNIKYGDNHDEVECGKIAKEICRNVLSHFFSEQKAASLTK